MEVKKSLSADLEGKKTTSYLIGLVLVLAAHFVAFEYTQRDPKKVIDDSPIMSMAVEEDMIPITHQEQTVAPPPAAAPTIEEVLEIVDDEIELNKEEVETSEELNQSVVAVRGTGGSVTAAPAGPPAVEQVEDDRIYDVVEENPQFPGGDAACLKWISDNLKYPAVAQEQNIQGRVMASFVVNRDGSVVDIQIVRSPDPSLSKEAERVLKLMPKWKPGKQRGKPVRVKYSLPVTFRLT